jgi:hypothetical protein
LGTIIVYLSSVITFKTNRQMKNILITLGLALGALTLSFNGVSQSTAKKAVVETTTECEKDCKKACCTEKKADAKKCDKSSKECAKKCSEAKAAKDKAAKESGVEGSKETKTTTAAATKKSCCSKDSKKACSKGKVEEAK